MVKAFLFFLISFVPLPSLLGQFYCDSISDRNWFYHNPVFDISDSKNDVQNIYNFIVTNLKYPETAKENKVEGTVFVTFWIDTTGNTSQHKISKGIREDLDNEALRVAKLLKFDIPAKNVLGNPIGICFSLPIRFRLSDPEFLLYKQHEKGKEKSKSKYVKKNGM